ncbi:SatD family protein [Arthrobacter sp. zg-Y820]|uniref:SatD family protein n=1 Tax=unclassified Arthrobacter TaxID=235627 RepID=UPI001E5F5101|nr:MULTISPECIES: SatD family protein [unclassified Arthrobacter]MCC9198148.1 SatD family protein [Arthrobacter sp. zg-Y820]MDK1281015.1 SatD family protein [Arthrobacter sp. zg.Y820]WIB10482.1 SatD family protein [Arthrobacter sp. zg-Y820]
MFVLTIDQKGSRSSRDRVPDLLALLGDLRMELPFERSVGDEVQGVTAQADVAVEAALRALRDGHWSVGIGVGPVDTPLPAGTREASGPAFFAARDAVDRAKKTGDRPPVAVTGPAGAAEAEAVLVLIGRLIRDRTAEQWRILEQVEPGIWGAQSAAARKLGISPQSVGKTIARAGWQEEWAARPAASVLLARADETPAAGETEHL